jgi:hypothetical protein
MAVRLNGWQRLWLVLSFLYLAPILALAAVSWPTAATTRHREEFIERLPDELQARVEAAFDSEYSWKDSLRSGRETSIPPPPDFIPEQHSSGPLKFRPGVKMKGATPLPPRFTLISAPVNFPNGAVLQVRVAKEGDTEPDARVGPAYWSIVEAQARSARWTMLWRIAGGWFIPCFALYALGWAAAWVRRGFKATPGLG